MSEIALAFLIANLAAGAAILLVLALRKPVRQAFGARLAYALWLLAPLAALGSLLPPRVIEVARQSVPVMVPAMGRDMAIAAPEVDGAIVRPDQSTQSRMPAASPEMPAPMKQISEPAPIAAPASMLSPDVGTAGVLVWFIGAIATAVWLARNQARFMADARAGFAGPAVVGLLKPRIVTPSDFEERFNAPEREVILAHETTHLARFDAQINAAVTLVRCLCWFNPLVHIGAHVMRIDQELACDAAVVARHPRAKAVYASALLKAQLAARPLPLGCYWPAGEDHPLTERIEMLKQAAPGHARRLAGVAALVVLALGACAAAWAARPPEQRVVEAPPQGSQPIREGLRLVALRDASLTVQAADGTIFMKGMLRAGESRQLRTGAGWTVSTNDGSAFEWRVNDQPLGLLAPRGGPVSRQSVDRAPTPVQYTPSPQQQKSQWEGAVNVQPDMIRMQLPSGPGSRSSVGFYTYGSPVKLDRDAGIHLRGKVEAIEFGQTSYVVRVRAASISQMTRGRFIGGYNEPNTALWELSPINYFDNADSLRADLMGADIEVNGTVLDAACKPDCKLKVQQLFTPRSSEVPPPNPDDSMISFFTGWYDTSRAVMVLGHVDRIEFSDRLLDLYVRTQDRPGDPGKLFQVRSEYSHSRADIERELLGKRIIVQGWYARQRPGNFCAPVCGVFGETITVRDSNGGASIALSGPVLAKQWPLGPALPADLNCPPKPGTPIRDGYVCTAIDPGPNDTARSAILWQ